MSKPRAYPPSGKILLFGGFELNTAPPPLLLQVIELLMAEQFMVDRDHATKLLAELHKTLAHYDRPKVLTTEERIKKLEDAVRELNPGLAL